jgi:hypothetical protein
MRFSIETTDLRERAALSGKLREMLIATYRSIPPVALYNSLGFTLAWWIQLRKFHADNRSASFQFLRLSVFIHFA